MRRCTKRSGRAVSRAPAAERWSLRKPRMRSRASGGSCGDSVAATSAPTMSSLRRRAICTLRAMSIGAQLDRRAREGAHDGAGVAGVDQQAQPGEHVLDLGALEERGRAGQVVGHRALLERDGDRLALVAHGAHEHPDLLGRHPRAHEPLDLACRALRLGALVGAAPEAHAAARRRVGGLLDAPLDRRHHGLRRLQDGRRRAQRALAGARCARRAARRPGRAGSRAPRRARGARAQSSSPAAVSPPCSPPSAATRRRRRELEVLGVVDEHVAPARRDPRAHVGLVAQQRDGAQEQVAEVQGALLAQHPVVGLVERRRTRARARPAGRPAAARRPSARPRRR